MEMLLTPDKVAVDNIYTESRKVFPDPSIEVIPLSVGKLKKISNPTGTRLWEPEDISGWTIRAAIGKSFLPPIAGDFTLTQGAKTTDTIPYNATASDIQDALQLAGIYTEVEEIGTGYFKITFTIYRAEAQLTSDAANLAPLSFIEIATLIDGDSDTREVQTIRLLQSPAAYAQLTTNSTPPDAVVTVLATGASGVNHKIRLTLDPLPYDGRFSLKIGGHETAMIPFDASEDEMKAALEALSSVGAGNVSVFRETIGSYLVSFQGTKAATNMGTITADDSALRGIVTKSGNLDLRTPAIRLMMMDEGAEAFLEIEGTPPAGTPQKLYKQPVTIVSPIISPEALMQPDPSEYVRKGEDIPYSVITGAPPPPSTEELHLQKDGDGSSIYIESKDPGTGDMINVRYGPAGTSPGPSITWNGKMKFPNSGSAPNEPEGPAEWLEVEVHGTQFRIPLYW